MWESGGGTGAVARPVTAETVPSPSLPLRQNPEVNNQRLRLNFSTLLSNSHTELK